MKKTISLLIILFLALAISTSYAESEPCVPILVGEECLGCEEDGIVFETEYAWTSAFQRALGQIDYEPAIQLVTNCTTGCPEYSIKTKTCPEGEKGVRILLVGGIHRAEATEERLRPETFLYRVYVKDGYINVALVADVLTTETIAYALQAAMDL